MSVQLVSKISNLCVPDPPTLQTDGQTTCDRKTALCTIVHRAVKTVFGRGSAPDPLWGSLRRSPDSLVGWGGGTAAHTHPPRRLRVSISTRCLHSPRFLGPTNKKFWIGLCCSGGGARMIFLQGGTKFEVTPLRLSSVRPCQINKCS